MVRHIYVPKSREYKSNRKLSEKIIKRKLEKEGWTVWRGGSLNAHRSENYPNVIKKYSLLDTLLGEKLELLQYLCEVHHGMPDFFCHRKGECKFVECKFENEQLNALQKKCIARLMQEGYIVEVHKLTHSLLREGYLDLETNKRVIVERQMKLKRKYKSSRQ
jgi:hypothetical protein